MLPTLAYYNNPLMLRALPQRQRQIIDMITFGLHNKEIAWILGVAEGTVKAHQCRVMQVLGTRNRVQLAFFAVTGSVPFDLSGNRTVVDMPGLDRATCPVVAEWIPYGYSNQHISVLAKRPMGTVREKVRMMSSLVGGRRIRLAYFVLTGERTPKLEEIRATYAAEQDYTGSDYGYQGSHST